MLVLIKLAIFCYGCWWAWNKLVNKRDVTVSDLKEVFAGSDSSDRAVAKVELQVEVLATLLGDVDDDGDAPCKVNVRVKNPSEYDLSRFSFTTVLKTDDGVIFNAWQEETCEKIKSGGSRKFTLDIGHIVFADTLWGVNTTVKAVAYGVSAEERHEVDFPKGAEGPVLMIDSIALNAGITLDELSCALVKSDEKDDASDGRVILRGILNNTGGRTVDELKLQCAIKSSGGRLLGEVDETISSIPLSGNAIRWPVDIDNVARLSGATLHIRSELVSAVAEGEGLGEDYEDADTEEANDDIEEDEEVAFSEDDEAEDNDEELTDEEGDSYEEEGSSDEEEHDDAVSDDVESKVAIITLQIQSLQSFTFAQRADISKPPSIEEIKSDFERIELTFYPELPCRCSVQGPEVRDIQVTADRVQRRYTATVQISANEEEYEKVKSLLLEEGFFKGGIADWSGAISSLIWDTNKAPDYADFSGEQLESSLCNAWVLDVDGEDARPSLTSLQEHERAYGTAAAKKGAAATRSSNASAKSLDITAHVRSVQTFSFSNDGDESPPTRSRIERDFQEVACALDPIPPGTCEVTDVRVEDVKVTKNGVTRAFSCVVHVSASGNQLRALQKLMAEEQYMNGGEIDWSSAIGAFLSECYECPDYACFSEERVTVDTTEAECEWIEGSSQRA